VKVYGWPYWQAMLTITPAAGPVRNPLKNGETLPMSSLSGFASRTNWPGKSEAAMGLGFAKETRGGIRQAPKLPKVRDIPPCFGQICTECLAVYRLCGDQTAALFGVIETGKRSANEYHGNPATESFS
jgi:hypothetical protein